MGIPLDESYTDSARSAYKGEHVGKDGALGRFLAAIQSGAVSRGSILIVENLDRISRQGPKIARKLFEKIVDEGVAVHVVNLELKLTYGWENHPNGYRVDNELHRAFKESQRKSMIIKAGLTAVKHSDDWCGRLPFWLQKVDEQGHKKAGKDGYIITAIPEEAEIVQEIFRLAEMGLGARRILQALKAKGFKRRISLTACSALLRDRSVLGEHQPYSYLDTGRVADGDPVMKFPRIIDQDQFNAVAALLDGKIKICADGKVRPATGNRNSHEVNNLCERLLFDITTKPVRTMQYQNKEGATNPFLISKWEPGRKSNRIRYDLFESDFLHYLSHVLDWGAVAREGESEALRRARAELNVVKAERDQAEHLLARRTEQAKNPDLPDAVIDVYNAQIAEAGSRIATLTAQQYRLEGLISLESMKANALRSPEKLIAMILSGDPAMRLNIRAEIRRVITRIELDFKSKPGKIDITVSCINGVTRKIEFVKFTKPSHPGRTRAIAA